MKMTNKHSALSGDDNIGELVGEFPERDLRMEEELYAKLHASPELSANAEKIKIKVKDGFASLTGKVDSESTRTAIKQLVEKHPGIEDVAMLLEIIQQ